MPLVTSANPGWPSKLEPLPPGDHVAVLSGSAETGLVGRLAGLELRDVLTVLLPGPRTGFVFLFRKPLSEPTVASQTLATGTGGLNIGACRVGVSGGTRRSGQAQHLLKDDGTEDRSHHWARTGHTVMEIPEGRWPPNVLLVHTRSCKQVGTRQVKGDPRSAKGMVPDKRENGFVNVGAFTINRGPSGHVHGDANGLETIAEYECAEGCPVRLLDEQSGDRPGMPLQTHRSGDSTKGYHRGWGPDPNSPGYGDSGGASRFYPQFEDDEALVGWLSELVGCHPSG